MYSKQLHMHFFYQIQLLQINGLGDGAVSIPTSSQLAIGTQSSQFHFCASYMHACICLTSDRTCLTSGGKYTGASLHALQIFSKLY